MIPRLRSLVADLETLMVNERIEPLQAVYIRKVALLPLLKHPRSRHSLWGKAEFLAAVLKGTMPANSRRRVTTEPACAA